MRLSVCSAWEFLCREVESGRWRRLCPVPSQCKSYTSPTAVRSFDRRIRKIGRNICARPPVGASTLDGRFLAIETERLDHGTIADREEDRVLAAGVLMRVLRPARQRDDVALRPVEALAVDDARAFPAHHVEHRAAGRGG